MSTIASMEARLSLEGKRRPVSSPPFRSSRVARLAHRDSVPPSVDALMEIDPRFPTIDKRRRQDLLDIRKGLEQQEGR